MKQIIVPVVRKLINSTKARFKRALFIRTKHNKRILGVILFIMLQNQT